MTLRKIATLLLGAGLTLGVLGAGISASFSDSLSATENIQVGTLGCIIDSTTAGDIAAGGHSLTYDAGKIMSSAAGSAPFTFVVKATGDMPVNLHLTQTPLTAPFSSILGSPADVVLDPAETQTYEAGLQWDVLGPTDMGDIASITYTVECNEYVAPPAQPDTYQYASSNAANQAAGDAYAEALWGPDGVTLTFHQPNGYYQCFEYRTDGNVPEQRLAQNGPPWVVGPPFRVNLAVDPYGYTGINDLYRYECLYLAGSSGSVGPLAATSNVEVRMAFGAENSQWFGWTSFPKP